MPFCCVCCELKCRTTISTGNARATARGKATERGCPTHMAIITSIQADHATQDLFNPILNVIKPLSSRQPRRNCKHDIGVLGVATQSQPLLFLAFLVADVGCTGNQPQLSHKSSLSCFIDGTVFLEKNASESHTWGVLSKLAASAPAHRACLAHATGATDLQFN